MFNVFKNIFNRKKEYIWEYEHLDDFDDIIENTIIKCENPYEDELVITNDELNYILYEDYEQEKKGIFSGGYSAHLSNPTKYPKEYTIYRMLREETIDMDFTEIRNYMIEDFDRIILYNLFELKTSYYVNNFDDLKNLGNRATLMAYRIFMRLPEELLPNIKEWVNNEQISDIIYEGKTLTQRIEESNLNYNLGFVQCLLDLVKDKKAVYKSRGQVLYWIMEFPLFYPYKNVMNNTLYVENVPDEFLIAVLEWFDNQEVNIYKYKGISLKGCIWAANEYYFNLYLSEKRFYTNRNEYNVYNNNKPKDKKLLDMYCKACGSLNSINYAVQHMLNNAENAECLLNKKTFYRNIMHKY